MSIINYSTSGQELQEILEEKLENLEKRQRIKKEQIESKLIPAINSTSVRENVKSCGSFVALNENGNIIAANFCKHRLCNVCNWRAAAKKWHRTKNIIDSIGKATYVHMVVTLRNCTTEELNSTITHIMKSINRMCSRPTWKKRVLGYIRSLEITYNPEQKDGLKWHPHYHYILCLPYDYETNTDIYLSTYEWRKMWEKSARIDYNTQFHFQVIKDFELSNAVAEVSKYAVKAAKIFDTISEKDNTDLKALLKAIKGRRLYSLGGIIKEIDKTANPKEYKEPEEKISDFQNSFQFVYHAKYGYVKASEYNTLQDFKVNNQESVNQKSETIKERSSHEDKPP